MQPVQNLIDDLEGGVPVVVSTPILEKSFYACLVSDLPDTRGQQGKKHNLAFVVFGFILGIMHKRSKKASICRFMHNKLGYLKLITGHNAHCAVSEAQLGRILSGLDWVTLNELSMRHVGVYITCHNPNTPNEVWLSGDGKDLRGGVQVNDNASSSIRGEVSVRFIEHESKKIVAQTFYDGDKESEKIFIRNLLENNKLFHKSITLDALHCDPKTTEMIHKAHGKFLIRVKENQEQLLKDLRSQARRELEDKRFLTTTTYDKGHGRIEVRAYTLFDVSQQNFDARWHTSNIQTLVEVNRQRQVMSKNKETLKQQETAYFISNYSAKKLGSNALDATAIQVLSKAVRRHWSIETDNHIRDVTLGEDKVKTQKGNRTRAEATIRTIALEWLKLENPQNYMAALEQFADSETKMTEFLIKYNFITKFDK
jgi:predicted transposase YbfD/YdcC